MVRLQHGIRFWVRDIGEPEGAGTVSHQRAAEAVIARWREVERQLAETPEGPEAEDLRAEAAKLRDEYQALIHAAQDADRGVAPPFGETVG
jgi:predicted aminopeptidase